VASDIYIFQPIRKHNSPSSHVKFLNGWKILKNVDDQLSNTSAIFGSNLSSTSVWNSLKCVKLTDINEDNNNGHKVMSIPHRDLWSR
jgi:hypothetical protein